MLPEEQKIQEKKLLRWQFWFLVTLSLLLVLLFVYYLPARFQQTTEQVTVRVLLKTKTAIAKVFSLVFFVLRVA